MLLILVLPVVTQCMKRDLSKITSSPPKTTKILQSERDTVILYNSSNPSPYMELALYQQNHQLTLTGCKDMIFLNQYKNVFVNGYSFLGLAAMSIHFKIPAIMRPPFASPENNFSIRDALHHEKDSFIQKLLTLGFAPTPEDKKIARIEKWERCEPIIKNICLLYCANKHNNTHFLSHIPYELIQYIMYHMFETEESLF